MCFMFGCCGPPPFATIKAYDNTTPFALDWFDNRDGTGVGGSGGIRETAIIDWNDETGYTTGVLSCGDGSEVTGSTNEKAVVERDADDGDRQTESVSTPLTAQSPFGGRTTLMKSTAVSGPAGGTWMWTMGSPAIKRLQFFDLDIVQSCTFTPGAVDGAPWSVGLADQLQVIDGRVTDSPGTSTVIARKRNESGTITGTLLKSGLTVTGGRTLTRSMAMIPRLDTETTFLVLGDELSGSTYYRQLWLCDKTTMAQTAVGTPVAASDSTQRYLKTPTTTITLEAQMWEVGRCGKSLGNYAIIHLDDGDQAVLKEHDATLVCIDTTTPQELWTKSDKSRVFVAIDSTQVYTVDPEAGELSALTLTTGAEAWTLDLSAVTKLGVTGIHGGLFYGAVLSSGNIAVWRNAGVTIVTTAGVEVATVDVGPCYGIVEKSNRWLIVGAKRTTSS